MTTKILHLLSLALSIPSDLLAFSPSSLKTLKTINENQAKHEASIVNPRKTLVTFLTAQLHPSFSSILGGKGGFGTLLKNQSKKSGAKTTLDFGACRDLNGRRLRHVNDEIKLRKWRANLNSSKNGRASSQEQQIEGWHLDIPNWAAAEAGSEKARKRSQMKLRREKMREEEERERKKRKKEEDALMREQLVLNYADQAGLNHNTEPEDSMENSIKQGLRKRMKLEKNKKQAKSSNESEYHSQDDDTNWLCALAGDFDTNFLPTHSNSTENTNYDSKYVTTYILGKSEFSTACILRPNLDYYEIVLETSGLSQIGFADISSAANFAPNTDTGDGVGDDEFSYGYDASRSKIFHNYKEFEYPKKKSDLNHSNLDENNPSGNVVGCWFNSENDEISFFLNGENLGIAFSVKEKRKESPNMQLIPAFSLNQDEIVGIRLGPIFQFNPCLKTSSTPILDEDISKKQSISKNENQTSDLEWNRLNQSSSKISSSTPSSGLKLTSTSPSPATTYKAIPKPTSPELLDLSPYESAESLCVLGLERLKSALIALGVKCGGSLEERAKRLFSLKGLQRSEYPKKVRGKNFTL